MILIYAFSNQWGTNISTRTLLELQGLPSLSKEGLGVDFIFQKILKYPHPFFNEYIRNKQYTAIIGLGDIYGDFDKIKIETQANNLYGRHSILPNAPSNINLDLPYFESIDNSKFYLSQNMGTYNCNWIAYQIQSYINQKSLTCYHLFFHLPPKSKAGDNAKSIADLLITNRVLQ